ncbi:MAG TPA: hypothetical protein VE078_04440, partial [Thermoanaerobaculia bacterium]|nr:hypothetical protein [Thermoanaerobaculia bacterium]
MEKRLLLAAALSLGILILWEWVVPKPARPPASSPAPPVAAATPSPAKQTALPAPSLAVSESVSARQESLATLENAAIRATFSNRGAVMTSLILKRYTDGQGRPLELVRASSAPRPFALAFSGNEEAARRAASALFAVEKGAGRELRFRFGQGPLG